MGVTNTIPEMPRGGRISAAWLNQVRDAIIDSIVPGPGISITRVGGRIVIALAENQRQIIPKG